MSKEKVCSFYVSEYHLLTIILPYINEKINERKKITVISQKDLSFEVKKYLKNVKNINFNKEKILNLNWKVSKNVKSQGSEEIICIGEKEYIDNVNFICKENNIINCFEVEKIVETKEILDMHQYILSTNGLEKIMKNSHNAQKRGTVKSQL